MQMQMASPQYSLCVYALVVALQVLSALGNGFIVCLFRASSTLRKNTSLRLVLALAISDLLFALLSLPYALNYIIAWSPDQLNYNGLAVVALAAPLALQFKLNLILTSAIAVDRLQAMRWPLLYRSKSQCAYVGGAVAVGLGLGAVDVFLQNFWSPVAWNPGCGAVGCFSSAGFLVYLRVSLEFAKFRRSSVAIAQQNSGDRKAHSSFVQATNSRLSMGVLAISVVFLLIPSTCVSAFEVLGLPIFALVGPFYIVGLLLAGLCNSVVYIWLHVELRAAARKTLFRAQGLTNTAGTAVAAVARVETGRQETLRVEARTQAWADSNNSGGAEPQNRDPF